jgi:hypothetical protein
VGAVSACRFRKFPRDEAQRLIPGGGVEIAGAPFASADQGALKT